MGKQNCVATSEFQVATEAPSSQLWLQVATSGSTFQQQHLATGGWVDMDIDSVLALGSRFGARRRSGHLRPAPAPACVDSSPERTLARIYPVRTAQGFLQLCPWHFRRRRAGRGGQSDCCSCHVSQLFNAVELYSFRCTKNPKELKNSTQKAFATENRLPKGLEFCNF